MFDNWLLVCNSIKTQGGWCIVDISALVARVCRWQHRVIILYSNYLILTGGLWSLGVKGEFDLEVFWGCIFSDFLIGSRENLAERGNFPADYGRRPNPVSMLGQHLRCWSSIETALGRRPVTASFLAKIHAQRQENRIAFWQHIIGTTTPNRRYTGLLKFKATSRRCVELVKSSLIENRRRYKFIHVLQK